MVGWLFGFYCCLRFLGVLLSLILCGGLIVWLNADRFVIRLWDAVVYVLMMFGCWVGLGLYWFVILVLLAVKIVVCCLVVFVYLSLCFSWFILLWCCLSTILL